MALLKEEQSLPPHKAQQQEFLSEVKDKFFSFL